MDGNLSFTKQAYPGKMWSWRRLARLGPDFHGLQQTAERAGHALACPFASSAEFEAANIQAKRDAGVYGPKRQRRQIVLALVLIAVLTFSLTLIL